VKDDYSAVSAPGLLVNEVAAAILLSTSQAVNTILRRRAELDSKGQYNKLLVVLAGENHTNLTDKAHHMLIVKELAESGMKIVFGHEEQHNLLSQLFFQKMDHYPDPTIAQKLQQSDPDGTLAMQCLSTFRKSFVVADHTRSILYRYLWRNSSDIPVRLTDVSRPEYYLDLDDPSTYQSMKKCQVELSAFIHGLSPGGFKARNDHNVTLIKECAVLHEARIAVLQCGNDHVVGNQIASAYGIYPAAESLSAFCTAKKVAVLAMPIFSKEFNENHIPVDHGLSPHEKLFRTGIPEYLPIFDPEIDMQVKHELQAAYMNTLLQRIGLEGESMSVEEYWQQMVRIETAMMKQFERWEEEFYLPFQEIDNNTHLGLQ